MVNTLIIFLRRREEGLNLIPLISRLRQMEVNKEGIRLEKSKSELFLKDVIT